MGRYHGMIVIRCKYKFMAYIKAKKMLRWIEKVNKYIDGSILESKILKYDFFKVKEYYDIQQRTILNAIKKLPKTTEKIIDKQSLDFREYDELDDYHKLFSCIEVIHSRYANYSTKLLYVLRKRKGDTYYDDLVKWDYGIVENDFYFRTIFEEDDKKIEWMVKFSFHN